MFQFYFSRVEAFKASLELQFVTEFLSFVSNGMSLNGHRMSCCCLMQLYVYEYTEDSDIAKAPRQIYPYAVVDYYYTAASDDIRIRSSVRSLSFVVLVYEMYCC